MIYKYDYIKPNTRFMLKIYEQIEKDEDEATKNRMNKYLDRGFAIKFHPKYDKINTFVIDMLKLKKYNISGHQNCIIDNHHEKYYHGQNNIKYVDNGEIDLSIFDIY